MAVLRPSRPVIRQDFTSQLLVVGTAATPLNGSFDINSLITSFAIKVPSTAANSIFMGTGGVTITNGFEIEPGDSPVFLIENYKQPYELQGPLIGIEEHVKSCEAEADALPFIVWDPSQIFLVAAAATNVSVIFFKEMFI
jgi:hypothetical protein